MAQDEVSSLYQNMVQDAQNVHLIPDMTYTLTNNEVAGIRADIPRLPSLRQICAAIDTRASGWKQRATFLSGCALNALATSTNGKSYNELNEAAEKLLTKMEEYDTPFEQRRYTCCCQAFTSRENQGLQRLPESCVREM